MHGNRLLHVIRHGTSCLGTICLEDNAVILLNHAHYILSGFGVLRAQSATKIGKHFGLRNTDLRPLLILHVLRHNLMFKLIEIFLTLGIFFTDLRIALDLIEHFLNLIMEIVIVPGMKSQLCAATIPLHPFLSRGNNIFTNNIQQRRRVIQAGHVEPICCVQVIVRTILRLIQLLLPEHKVGREIGNAQVFESAFRNRDLSQKREIFFQFGDFQAIQKTVCQKGCGNNDCHNPKGLEQLSCFDAVIHLREVFSLIGVPFQIEGRVANHIIKTHIWVIIANILVFQICGGIEIVRNLVGFNVQFTSVEISFHRHIVTEVCDARCQIGNGFIHTRLQSFHHKLTEHGRRVKLSVLDLLLGFRKLVVIVVIRTVQTVQSTIAGIGIENILTGNSRLSCQILIHQIEDLFIQLLTGFLRDRLILILVFHHVTCFQPTKCIRNM